MCAVEWLDQKTSATGRIARVIDSDCSGVNQFSSVAGHCGRAGGGFGGAGTDAGDVDGAVAVSEAVPRGLGSGGGRLPWFTTRSIGWVGGRAWGAMGWRRRRRCGPVLPLPVEDWLAWFARSGSEAIRYLPVAIPLALATVVGGIDCTESAAAAGDDYPTGQIIAAEGFATLVGGSFGGVIQSTPYIGHPAYKAMGARSAYTLATAIFVGAAGIFGYFDWIFFLIPKAVIFPILIFVGLEITAQSFHATPVRHLSGGGPGVRARAGLPGAARAEPGPARTGQAVRRAEAGGRSTGSKRSRSCRAAVDSSSPACCGDCTGAHDRRPGAPAGRDLVARGRLFLVWRHSFALAFEPDHDARRRDPAVGSGRTSQGIGLPNALSLGGRLRSRWPLLSWH